MAASDYLKGIETFVTVADMGSFTAAAGRLHLTTSAISKSVARLESRLGVQLFVRTTRQLVLSSAGTAFYTTCARVLTELDEARAVMAAEEMEPVGRIRINLPATFGRMQVMPALLSFFECYPRLVPHVIFTDRFVDLIEEGVDIAVRIGAFRQPGAGLSFRHLGTEQLVLCAAPAYLERQKTICDIKDLISGECILYGRADGSTTPWRVNMGNGQIEQRTMSARMVLGSAEAQIDTVKAGLGVAQLATWLIREELENGTLVEILPDHRAPGLDLHLVWPSSRQLTPKVDACIQWLEARLRID